MFYPHSLRRWSKNLRSYCEDHAIGFDTLMGREELRSAMQVHEGTFQRLKEEGVIKFAKHPTIRKKYKVDEVLLALSALLGIPQAPDLKLEPKDGDLDACMKDFQAACDKAREAYRRALVEEARTARERGDVFLEVLLLREFATKGHLLK